MTLVHAFVDRPSQAGLVPARGTHKWKPTARRIDPPSTLVMPTNVDVRLGGDFLDLDGVTVIEEGVDGEYWIEVHPADVPNWAWEVTERVDGADHRRYFDVPDQALVEYTDLLENYQVDPDTLDPDEEATAAWYLELNDRVPPTGTTGHVLTKGAGGTNTWTAGGGGGTVESVNGDAGPDVVLDAADVGAATSTALDANTARDTVDFRASRSHERNQWRLTVTDDTAVVTVNSGADAAFNRSYTRGTGASPNATWPVDTGNYVDAHTGGGLQYQSSPQALGLRTLRFVTDGDEIAMAVFPLAVGNALRVYVDGQPATLDPTLFGLAAAQYTKIVFPAGKRTRLVEVRTSAGISAIYCKKPHKIWKPPAPTGIKVAVVGDSYTSPSVLSDTDATASAVAEYGIYQSLAPLLNVDDILVNGIGGTGYLKENGGGGNNYYQRRATIYAHNPDMLVRHGGGANDLNAGGFSVAATVAQAILLFTADRTALPNAKLVFVEGFAPPGSGFSTLNPDYIDIRTQLQAALTAIGVYYIDVAATSPWINGTGYVTAPGVDGENSAIYVGYDGVHPSVKGHTYIRNRIARPLRRVLYDRGELLNTLIAG